MAPVWNSPVLANHIFRYLYILAICTACPINNLVCNFFFSQIILRWSFPSGRLKQRKFYFSWPDNSLEVSAKSYTTGINLYYTMKSKPVSKFSLKLVKATRAFGWAQRPHRWRQKACKAGYFSSYWCCNNKRSVIWQLNYEIKRTTFVFWTKIMNLALGSA